MRIIQLPSTPRGLLERLVPLLAPFAALGCTEAVEDTPEQVAEVADELFLTGDRWGAEIGVCYGAEGYNPALVADAQRLLRASWSRAANVAFVGWGPCASAELHSEVELRFCTGSSTSNEHCPKEGYDGEIRGPGRFRGRSEVGEQDAWLDTSIYLIGDDTEPFKARFRYQVMHEFGHVLGFAHEQNRPDNFDAQGTPIYCGTEAKQQSGTRFGSYDPNSVMNYCAGGLPTQRFPTQLSPGDIAGVRSAYAARNPRAHGFMILSDQYARGLAVKGGALEGANITLDNACTRSNPDCTWTYERGMLRSDRDPTLAIVAWNGAAFGTALRLTRNCTPANPDCTWTYRQGMFLSDRNPTLAINAWNGARQGAPLLLHNQCAANNPDCTWTLPHVMFTSAMDTTLGINAINGAGNLVQLGLHHGCDPDNPDCTFFFAKGMLQSSTNGVLAVNALNGARVGAKVGLHQACNPQNKDCTWTWTKGRLQSDNASTLAIKARGGPTQLARLELASCTPADPECVFDGILAQHLQ